MFKFILLFFTFSLFNFTIQAENIVKIKLKEQEVREQMIQISKELGVTCNECHNVSNFADASKPAFKISREHIKIVSLLKQNGFDGKKGTEASCFMCHQGKLNPNLSDKKTHSKSDTKSDGNTHSTEEKH